MRNPPGQLHGVGADVPGGAMDEDSLRRVYRAVLKDHLPSGASDDWHCSRVNESHSLGHLRELRRGCHGVLGVSPGEPVIRCAEHRVASPELRNPCTDVLDKPGHVGPQRQRKWLRKDALPGPHQGIPRADACCFHAQQHLAVARSRPRHVFRHERVETAEVVYADRLHDAPQGNDVVSLSETVIAYQTRRRGMELSDQGVGDTLVSVRPACGDE